MSSPPSNTAGNGSDKHGDSATDNAENGVDGGTLLDLATALALEAGSIITEMRDSAIVSASTKSSPTDPVTEADRRAESVIVAGILDARPDDGIIGEEGTNRTGRSSVAWHIDPIDGTTNYVYGIPAYAVSIAAEVDGAMTAGVVYNPAADELYRARSGHGATCNGRAISVGDGPDLASALVATGFGYRSERRRVQAEIMGSVLPAVRDVRRFGSAALDLCAVASGRVDAYYEAGLNSWDFAAGWLIAIEAGAVCDDLRGAAPNSRFLLAAAPSVHEQLTILLRDLDADRLTA